MHVHVGGLRALEGSVSSEAALPFPRSIAEVEAAAKHQSVETASDMIPEPTLGMVSDNELLLAAGRGNRHALGILFQRHGRAVFHVAWRILRDEGEAEDLRQEVFLYLFRKSCHYDPLKASAASWIIQIAYHRAIDRKRFLNTRQHYRLEELGEQEIGSLVTLPSTDQIDGKAILDRLREQLSRDQQQTLEMHFFEGYTFQEIADESGQSVGKVRHHYYRALERLRSNLLSKKRG